MNRVRIQKILVVDDEETQRDMFCRRLSAELFEVVAVNSGFDALTQIQELRPDLVLADISMPRIDGIEMLRIMRKAPQTAAIPVILMTGMPVPKSMLQAAADGLRAGPIHVKGDFPALLDRIKSVLSASSPSAAETGPAEHVLRKGPVTVDLIHREVVVSGRQVPKLSGKRFELLLSLLRHDGPVDQGELLRDVWGRTGDPKSVQMTVARLREDLRGVPALKIKTDGHCYQVMVTPRSSR
jgi:DNA-binding response OmpR family regulator